MHASVMRWVKERVEGHRLAAGDVIDVGSYDVNGTVRDLFTGTYTGVDLRDGPNVNRVVGAHGLVEMFGERSFDTVVCCEMLEHDPGFWISMEQMGRILRPGGRLLLTARGIGFPLHEYPDDLWRFTVQAGERLADLADLEQVEVSEDPDSPGIFLTGERRAD